MDPLAICQVDMEYAVPILVGFGWEPKLISISSLCGAALLPSSSFFWGAVLFQSQGLEA